MGIRSFLTKLGGGEKYKLEDHLTDGQMALLKMFLSDSYQGVWAWTLARS